MADNTGLFNGFITAVKQAITQKNTINSIDPVDVGDSITNLASLLVPILNTINQFATTSGENAPSNGNGVDGDEYFQTGPELKVWRKVSGVWILKATLDLGINVVDGNISVQSRVSGFTLTATAGQWGINNTIHTKAIQDQFTIDGANASLDRIDAVFGKEDNTVHYVAGTASANPDATKPVTTANEIIITYVYVPASSSGGLPYIADSNANSNLEQTQSLLAGVDNPDNSDGNNGDFYYQFDGASTLTFWQKINGVWVSVLVYAPEGGSGSSRIPYLGRTANSNGEIDLSGEINLPSFPSTTVYNTNTGESLTTFQYNALQGNARYGILYSLEPLETYNIYMIGETGGGGDIPPTVNAGSNQSVHENQTILNGIASGNGGASIISTEWTLLNEPSIYTPPAPTFGIVNNDLKTFSFTPSSGVPLYQHEYEFTDLDTGEVYEYQTVLTNPLQLPNKNIAVGQLKLRVKAILFDNPSLPLTNSAPFVKSVGFITFDTSGGLVKDGDNYHGSAPTAWHSNGMAENFSLSDSENGGFYVKVTSGSQQGILGYSFDNSVVNPTAGYTGLKFGVWPTNGEIVRVVDGAPVDVIYTAPVNTFVGLFRESTNVIKIKTSTDLVSWTDRYTFLENSSAPLYLLASLTSDPGNGYSIIEPKIF